MRRLAVLTTHPIQYQAPWFRSLAAHPELDLEVLFCHKATPAEQAAAGFGIEFDWDVSLLEGYSYRFLENVARAPTVSNFTGLDTPEIFNVIRNAKYDAVIVNGWHYKSAWQAMRACWQTKTPVMARSDSHLHTKRALLKRVAKRPFYSWFISKLAACLPVGKWSRDYFLHYGARPELIFIVPHVVDTDYFAAESARLLRVRNELRAHWKVNEAGVVFLFVGKFVDKKRPMDFVKALEQAAQRGAPAAGLMVGDGPLRSICETHCSTHNVPVHFAGFLNQSEIAKAYVAADALILPSNGGETWGLVANEAMACARPCLVSDHVGCGPDLIVPDETGAVFPLGDIGQLAALIERYSSEPGALSKMGCNAQAQIQSQPARQSVDNLINAISLVTAKPR